MEIAKRGPFILLRLDHGEDILDSIGQAVSEEQSTVMLTCGLGMMSDFELGYFDRGKYLSKEFLEPHELLSMQGSVACSGEPRVHVHATVAGKNHEAFGGHLTRGKVWMSNEMILVRIDGVGSRRVVDPQKRVGILHLESQ